MVVVSGVLSRLGRVLGTNGGGMVGLGQFLSAVVG